MTVDAFVDVGKSGTRLHVTGRDPAAADIVGDGIAPTQNGDLGAELGRIVTGLLATAAVTPSYLVIGSTIELTGAERGSLALTLAGQVRDAVVAVADDGTVAHARFIGAPGVLLSAGTGVIAIARSRGGEISRFDGWGPIAGDRGSAVEVGRAALREAYRAVDGRRPAGLRALVERELGPLDLTTADRLLGDERWPARLAGLAAGVCELADQEDADAARLLDTAVDDLAETARTAARVADVDGVLIRGRFGTAPAMRRRLANRLHAAGLRALEPLGIDEVPARAVLAEPYGPSFHRVAVSATDDGAIR